MRQYYPLIVLAIHFFPYPVEFVDRGRGGGRGRGNRGRGDRGGSRGDGRRTYDRHSATGKTYAPSLRLRDSEIYPEPPISDSEKKIHQSWGGDEGQTELATETAAANDAAAEQTTPAENWEPSGGGGDTEWGAEAGNTDWGAEGGSTDWAASAPAPIPTTNAEEPAERSDRRPRDRQEEEPDNTLTLDQYLAQQKEKSPTVPQLETRKIEQDEGLWKGAKEIVKGAEEDTYFVGKVCINHTSSPAFTHHRLDQVHSQVSHKEGGENLLGDRCPFRTPRQRSRPR